MNMNFITKLNLGNSCDFGAQIGEYAGLLAIAKKTNHRVAFLKDTLHQKWGFPLIEPFEYVPELIEYEDIDENNYFQHVIENKKFNYRDEVVFSLPEENNWCIDGGLSYYKYFHDQRDYILEKLKFKDEIVHHCKNYIEKNFSSDEILVSVHFRRGDYLTCSSLNLSMEYYLAAKRKIEELFQGKIKYLVFSNEIEWTRYNFSFENCIYVDGQNRYQDMCLMSMCHHNITANSCFSWWGAYLNKNEEKKVIVPYHYLGDSVDEQLKINGNFYPDTWISLYEK